MTLRIGRPGAAVRLGAYGLIALASVVFCLWRVSAQTLPLSSGSVEIAGLDRPVTLRRDTNGFVRIDAATDRDAFFATGFAHAQDRLWQMEVQRRIAEGTLSEAFGLEALADDVWMRNFQLRRRAERDLDGLSAEARASLAAYAAGVNAGRRALRRLPVEFAMFGVRPRPWSEADSLAWVKVFAMDLSGNMSREIRNHLTAEYLTPSEREGLQRSGDGEGYRTISDEEYVLSQSLAEKLRQVEAVERRLRLGGDGVGSNAWVVAGTHTASGRPILANDPHLKLQIPSLWYAIGQNGAQLHSRGMSLVGTPLVVFGHNGAIAWAGTNLTADVQDLAFHRVKPDDPGRYLYQDRWVEFGKRTEHFRIAPRFPAFINRTPVPVEVVYKDTLAGPVLTTYRSLFDYPVSLRWSALDAGDRSYQAFFDAQYARDWDGFLRAFERLGAPAMNLLYADAAGNIGYTAVGRIPVRAGHDGTRPMPAWSEDSAWTGYLPYAELPRIFNPPKGYIVNANNRVVGDAYPHFISSDWALAYRARRIDTMIAAAIGQRRKITPEMTEAMQRDTRDLGVFALRDYLLRTYASPEPRHRHALELIRGWDGEMRADSAGAAMFAIWTEKLRGELFLRQAEGYRPLGHAADLRQSLAGNATYAQIEAALDSRGCATASARPQDACGTLLRRSLDSGLRTLGKSLGRDPRDWSLAQAQEAEYPNLLRIEDGLIGRLFSRRLPAQGGPDTVAVSDLRLDPSGRFRKRFGAGFRHVVAFGDGLPAYRYLNSTGQSGNLFDRHYDDMIEPFESDGALLDADPPGPRSTLTLRPAKSGGGR